MQAALAEEKMYLLWLNRQRKGLKKPEVNDISLSLQDGTIIMEILAVILGHVYIGGAHGDIIIEN